ncbi:hypothetical protein FRB96_008422 [Tulasnella sp. 330]|nr:hypothetical protein FRB96_008422 [Tulasnella sp. 330]
MLGTMKTPGEEATIGKRKKWPRYVEPEAEAEIEADTEEFMNGDLKDDLKSLIKSLNLPEVAAKYAAGIEENGKEKRKEKTQTAPKVKAKAESTKIAKPEVSIQPSSSKPIAPFPNKHLKWQDDDKKVVVAPSVPSPSNKKGGTRHAIIDPMPQWYTSLPMLEPLPSIPHSSSDFIKSMQEKADTLLKDEATFAESGSTNVPASMGSSDKAFLSRMISSGTSSDRLSALTLMAQSSPVHNQRALETLKGMAGKRGREESLKALRAIVDLWVGGMAPERKLKYFVDQNLSHPAVGDKHLLLWAFEDWLKKYFFSLLQILESFASNTLPYVRTQSLNLIYILLRDRPEQEQNLLRLLANKLGDTDKSVSAKASYFLLQLLQQHPQMKAVVIREVSALILRPISSSGASSSSSSTIATLHARYYGILTFNQIVLTPQEKDVAQLLTTLYFELFVMILGSPITEEAEIGDADDEGGDNKQGPGSSDKKKKSGRRAPLPRDRRKLKERTERDGKKDGGTRSAEVTVGDAGFGEVEDGHSKMIAGILTGLNRALPFARMEETIFERHIDTLFRITHSATFNVSIQALVLILQVSAARQSISDRFYRTLYESLLDPRLVMSSKQAMYLNLLFKATKLDNNHGRLCAFVKRFLQALGMHQPSFICGALFLLGELFEKRPDLRKLTAASDILDDDVKATKGPVPSAEAAYDPRKRDPQFANAAVAPLWEIVPLLHHFHPSVALHARQILDGEKVTTTADLSLNTVSQFLDRFVYKNAKKPTARGASMMQPGTMEDGTSLVRHLRGVGDLTSRNLNEESFWNKPVAKVPVDQLFFHKFFSLKKRSEKAVRKPQKKLGDHDDLDDDDDEDSVNGSIIDHSGEDSDEEQEIWQAMKKSLPKGQGGVDPEDEEDDDISIPEDFDASDDVLPIDDDEASVGSDDEDIGLLDLNEMHDDGVEASDSEDDAWGGVSGVKRKKGGNEEGKDAGLRKKRKVALPTFASYDDYANMIDAADGDEEDE